MGGVRTVLAKTSTSAVLSYLLHVAVRLHRDDSAMILLVHPDDECLGGIVIDSSTVRPVSRHARGGKERRDGFVKHDVLLDHLLVLSIRHVGQRVVTALKPRSSS